MPWLDPWWRSDPTELADQPGLAGPSRSGVEVASTLADVWAEGPRRQRAPTREWQPAGSRPSFRLNASIKVGFTRPDGRELGMASERENREIEAANASGDTPVVFIHGLWLLPSSWANWADFFKQAGYAPLTPDWPGDPDTVEEARANPDVFAKKTLKQVEDHTIEVIDALDKKPAVMGHSTGGLLAQMLAGHGLSAVTVAIDPGVFRGVLPLPASVLKGVGPFLADP